MPVAQGEISDSPLRPTLFVRSIDLISMVFALSQSSRWSSITPFPDGLRVDSSAWTCSL